MWSDPSHLDGLKPNVQRGIGVRLDRTIESIYEEREIEVGHLLDGSRCSRNRPEMPSIQSGFCVDHDLGEDGKLVTIFSAPDYPQFRDFGDTRHDNEGAFIRLNGKTNF